VRSPPGLAGIPSRPAKGLSGFPDGQGPAEMPPEEPRDPIEGLAGTGAGRGLMRVLGQFDRMIALLSVSLPTASTVPLADAAMPAKKLTPPGVATMLQFLPFQCSVNGP